MLRGRVIVASLISVCASVPAWSQDFPGKPIHIVTSEVGGGLDFAARLVAQGLSAVMGQQVVVENRGGASGIIAAQAVSKSPPDGHTLLMYGSAIWVLPYLRDNVPYDPEKDFSPVTLISRSPNVLVVHPSLPANSVAELIALARSKPGGLNDAGGSSGSSAHLAAELFKAMAGVNIVRIAYKGNGPALTDLVSGRVQLMFAPAGTVASNVKSGKLRALAVTSAEPSALMPGLPAVASSGLPGYESVSLYALFAPARTLAPIITRLNQEVVRVLNSPQVRDKFMGAGLETVGSSPEQFAATMKVEMAKFGKIIRERGIREE